MMYPYMTLSDETEIVHSQLIEDKGIKKVIVNFERPTDILCISTHTVITHRRNIVAKLQIHSPAGLTIYAIVNKLVDLSDIRDTIAEI